MSENTEITGPCAEYKHEHPELQNVNLQHEKTMSAGQRVADRVASAVGSWPFIIIQSCLLILWMAVNVYLAVMGATQRGFFKSWDPYPFILLNLVLSFQAAYTGPVVMMSQNRQTEKDRLMAENDFEINRKAEEELQVVMTHLAHQDRLILDAIQRLESLQLPPTSQEMAARIDEVLHRIDQNDQRLMKLVAQIEGK